MVQRRSKGLTAYMVLVGAVAVGVAGIAVCPPPNATTTERAIARTGISHPANLGQVGTTIPGVQFLGAQPGDWTGFSVSGAGDVNDDGYEDLLIGAPGEDGSRGAGYLICGTGGVDGGLAGSLPISELTGRKGVRFPGEREGDLMGYSVSGTEDVDYDRRLEVIFGAPGADWLAPSTHNGAAYLIFGNDPRLAPITIREQETRYAAEWVKFVGAGPGDRLGTSVSGLGDAEWEDRFERLVLSAPGAREEAGSVYFFKGGGTWENLYLLILDWLYSVGRRMGGVDAGDAAGSSVSGAGDFNGDGVDDFLVGAPQPVSGGPGEAYLVFSSAFGDAGFSRLDGTNGVAFIGARAEDLLGWCVSGVGDVNGDGYQDILIGAPGADPEGREDAGAAYLICGTREPIGDMGLVDLADFPSTAGVVIEGARPGERAGCSVSGAGDVNGDGYFDLLIGAYNARTTDTLSGSGAVYLVFGSWRGIGTNGRLRLSDLDGTNGIRFDGASADDWAGFSVSSAGDVNGDGSMDFLIGAPVNSSASDQMPGKSYLVLGWTSKDLAVYRSFSRPMGSFQRGVGRVGDGSPLVPASRCYVDFSYTGGSRDTVAIERHAHNLTMPAGYISAQTVWRITSSHILLNRGARIGIHYVPDDFWWLPPDARPQLFQAVNEKGPYERLDTTTNTLSRTVEARVYSPGYFTLGFAPADTSYPPTEPTPTPPPGTPEPEIPIPPPGQFVRFTFDTSEEGWVPGSATSFEWPDLTWEPGRLAAVTPGSYYTSSVPYHTYGYWESPRLVAAPKTTTATDKNIATVARPLRQPLYRAGFTVSTNVSEQSRVPQLRLRGSAGTFEQSAMLLAISIGDGGFSPTPSGAQYPLYFTMPGSSEGFRLDHEVLNFDPRDAYMASLNLEEASVGVVSTDGLGPERPEANFTFAGQDDGWTSRTVLGSSSILPPEFAVTERGLLIRGNPGVARSQVAPVPTVFGYWGSPENEQSVVLQAGRLYRVTYNVSSTATAEQGKSLAPFRVRINDSSLRASAYITVEPSRATDLLPLVDQPVPYDLFFVAPDVLAGQPLLFSFDYYDTLDSAVDRTLGIILESIDVVSYAAPAE